VYRKAEPTGAGRLKKDTAHNSLLRTKLHRPPVSADYVHRSRILESLDREWVRPLTLVSAPAGYGKSILISGWLDTIDRSGAWLSLDEKDNDLRRFLSYFLSAIQTVFPTAGFETLSMLKAPDLPPVPALADSLINDLDRIEDRFILVLDDFHLIFEKAVNGFVRELLRHPPRCMHLVIISRKDPFLPISGLRARNMLAEVRTHDLRFSAGDTAEFLKLNLGVPVQNATAILLAEKTEGWVTGLRLAVIAMRGHKDLEHRLSGLTGTTRYLMDYLITEVLDEQPEAIRRFLLNSSILERFCAPLCDRLIEPDESSGMDGIDGEAFTVWAMASNLFVIPLDTENRWFRYHHLFRQLLQKEMKRRHSPEGIVTLHSRACQWFDENGLIEEALRHATAAGDVHRAAGIIEKNRHAALSDDKWFVVEKWLAQIPDENTRQSPELLLTRAWVLNHRFRLPAIPEILERVDSLLKREPSKQALVGELYFFKAFLSFWQGQLDSTIAYSEKSQEQVPKEKKYGLIRGDNEIYRAMAFQMIGKKEIGIRELDQKISSHPKQKGMYFSRLVAALCFVHMMSGDLKETETAAIQLREVSEKSGFSYANTWSDYMQACSSFHACDFDKATQHFAAAAEVKYIMHSIQALNCLAGLAFSYQMTGQTEKADETIKQLIAFAHETDDAVRHSIARTSGIRLSLLQGNAEAGSESIGSIDEEPGTGSFFVWLELPHVTHCRQLIATGSDDSLEEAAERLDALREAAGAIHNTFHLIDILVLKALAFYKRSRREEALKILEQALNLATPGGWIRPFLEPGHPMPDMLTRLKKQNVAGDFIDKILGAFALSPGRPVLPSASPSLSRSPSPLIEPLTHREMDVLELLAKRLQSKEIAERLSISPETVRTHLGHIYQKLSVTDRRQAVAMAKSSGIL
jgi:LuxR family maltose regulon positive regulatory protein